MSRFDQLEAMTASVIDCVFHIHRDIGPGLLESAYEALMDAALTQVGHIVKRQVPISMNYRGVVVDNAFKIDLLVDECLIVELKSIERLAPVHGKQLLTYLRLSKMPLGLLMNFGQSTFKDGLKRVANEYYSERFKL
ncbi:GxxExxY protein [Sphingorhabdus arenilitoris]|uniref:GxxExxY protein n=1 Tax=Sphingorhabdus arenilitoris TaxID=1490041 RepID=A0ABV8RGT7_9SPHN